MFELNILTVEKSVSRKITQGYNSQVLNVLLLVARIKNENVFFIQRLTTPSKKNEKKKINKKGNKLRT